MKNILIIVLFSVLPQVCCPQTYDVIGSSRSEGRKIAIANGYYFISITGENNECDTYFKYFKTFTLQLDQFYRDGRCVFFTFSGPTSVPESMDCYNSTIEKNKQNFSYNVESGHYELGLNGHILVFTYEIAYEFSKWAVMFMKAL